MPHLSLLFLNFLLVRKLAMKSRLKALRTIRKPFTQKIALPQQSNASLLSSSNYDRKAHALKIHLYKSSSRIFLTLLSVLPLTSLTWSLLTQRTLAQTAVCQSPYSEIYSGQTGNTIMSVHALTGAVTPLTTTALAGTVNSLASDHNNYLVYYAEGTSVYAWDVINNTHITITSNIRTFNASIPNSATVLSAGGAAFYNGSLYLGVDPPQAGIFEIYKVDFVSGSSGRVIQSVTPLNINGAGRANGALNNGDWGDFIISDTGIIYGSSGGTAQYWSFNLNTNTFTDLTDNIPQSSQLAKDGTGRLWAFRNSTNSVVQIQIVGNSIQTVGTPSSTGTHSSADGAECVVGGASVGDRVWNDADGDGVQDAGEPGIAGVTVAIYRDIDKDGVIDASDPQLATQTTDANGNYNFTGLLPHDRATGANHNDFIVQVISGVPAGATATTPTTRTADLSSATQTFNTADVGYRSVGTISGTLYRDTDGDNTFDTGEPRLPTNIDVQLLNSSGTVIATVQTDANGNYSFTNVPSGTGYQAQVVTSDPQIPTNYSIGTTNPITGLTVTGGATVANQNFGFDLLTVSLSGKVWDDADNSANNTFTNINTGTEVGSNAGGLNVILVNSALTVVATTPVNVDGTYTFTNITANQSNVTIRLSTTAGTVGSAAPAASVPANWSNTSPLATSTFNIGISNITGQDFGIEQLPDTTAVTGTSQTNPGGTTTVQVPTLAGTDPEDGTLGSGKSFKIVTLPTNGTLYYNGTAVIIGQAIASYDPTQLTLDPNDGAITVSFTYAAVDAAGKEDPTPATVTMPFTAPTADLSITKTDGQTTTTAGSSISYTIVVTNNGSTTVSSLTLTDTLPASIQNPVFTPSTGIYDNGTGSWTGLNLASGQSITLTVTGTVSSTATGSIANTATVAPPAGITDPTPANNTATDNTSIYAVAPTAGQIVINEVLYAQTGASSLANDEFIELYNASASPVDLSGWKLSDGNLIANDTDNTGSITGSSINPAYIFPSGTILQPGEYAVIWIGENAPDHQATDAAFQTWLGNAPKLNNAGDDIWLYDDQLRVVDYVAYGSGTAINTPPPASLNLWDVTYQSSLAGAATGQSISLTPNGQDGNASACWEPATSGQANGRCTGYLPTRDTDTVGSRVNSVGQNNNGAVVTPPNLTLVKRITAINGVDVTSVVDDPGSTNDNAVNWPIPLDATTTISTYLRGSIDGGAVRPGDILDYTIYFLSDGGTSATNVNLCDLVPANSTFVPDAFGNGTGISLILGGTTTALTNVPDLDGGHFWAAGVEPSVDCSDANTNGAVVVNIVDSPATLPNSTAPGTPANSYGLIRFRARVQ
jgi:uncharacterized repeat protein (TIGR01451 family)